MTEAIRRVRVTVRGRVQGVGFRYFTIRTAQDLGIVGWVRNTPVGTVEVEAQGVERRLRSFLKELERGPRAARVSGLEIEDLEPLDPPPAGFQVRF
jgi:acylphosphatase